MQLSGMCDQCRIQNHTVAYTCACVYSATDLCVLGHWLRDLVLKFLRNLYHKVKLKSCTESARTI